jgi:hypothetical protein
MPDATNALHTPAMSGIYLDIFERITPCWMHQGLELAQGEVRGVFKVWPGAALR